MMLHGVGRHFSQSGSGGLDAGDPAHERPQIGVDLDRLRLELAVDQVHGSADGGSTKYKWLAPNCDSAH
eukprot:10805329-Alexandrium_andersonii.AAC.1